MLLVAQWLKPSLAFVFNRCENRSLKRLQNNSRHPLLASFKKQPIPDALRRFLCARTTSGANLKNAK